MSEAHLGRYCADFDLRHHKRKISDTERSEIVLIGSVGKRLTHWRTDKLAA